MALTRLVVTHFRNLNQIDLNVSSGFNFIIGANGSGKTSVLEALYYLGHAKSFKSNINKRIISYDQQELILFAELLDEHKSKTTIGLMRDRSADLTLKINGQTGHKIADLAHLLPMQTIMPEGLNLLCGSPSFRRAFLDWGLFYLDGEFKHLWRDFVFCLKQRNALLHSAEHYDDLVPWDKKFAQLTEKLTALRAWYSEIMQEEIAQTLKFFLPEVDISLSFYAGFNQDIPFLEILRSNFDSDKKMGHTLVGAQKGDLRLKINQYPVSDVLSRGQLKLLMCALRLAQGEQLMHAIGKPCIFLIDDFASELDSGKRALLIERLRKAQSQVFISAISLEQIKELELLATDRIFHLNHGTIAQTPLNV